MLTRDSITASSRLMLWVYPALSGYLGVCFLLGDPERTNTPSFELIREMLPMKAWGGVFLGLTALKVAAWLIGRRDVMILALCLGFAFYAVWSVTFLITSIEIPFASLTGPGIWAFIALAHIASLRSLTKDSPR